MLMRTSTSIISGRASSSSASRPGVVVVAPRPTLSRRRRPTTATTTTAAASAATPPPPPPPPPPQQEQQQQQADSEGSSSSNPGSSKQQQRRRQADSTDAVASFLTRRFGIAGGLAWLGVLTFGVVSEQLKTRRELAEEAAGTLEVAGGSSSAPERALPGGASYRELRVGGGGSPRRGDLVVLEFSARFSTDGGATFADPPFLDTKTKRPVVLVWGARPLAGGICEGVEAAIADGMRAGGRRLVTVPPGPLAFGSSPPPGVPPGAVLQYDVTLSRVSVAPS